MRVGLGFDHRDTSPDALAEVIQRAAAEAIRGASGLDIPAPPTPEAEDKLRDSVRLIERHNYQVVNLDVTVLSDTSHPEAALREIRERVAAFVHVAPTSVTTKEPATNPIPWLQAGGGVAAIAITLLDQISDLDALHASIRSGG